MRAIAFLNYVEHTQHLGLTFCPGHIRLTSFVDSSFADVIENHKSTSGLIQYIGTSPIYWDSFVVNTTVPLSTAELEYVAAYSMFTRLDPPRASKVTWWNQCYGLVQKVDWGSIVLITSRLYMVRT